jgi:hypothetical protein
MPGQSTFNKYSKLLNIIFIIGIHITIHCWDKKN